ncbi:hypothetical protein TNCV_642981 [Trichonephila clavipes]|nr:hypothetical protein TNCV_642981 [Trichonephila clavipes]
MGTKIMWCCLMLQKPTSKHVAHNLQVSRLTLSVHGKGVILFSSTSQTIQWDTFTALKITRVPQNPNDPHTPITLYIIHADDKESHFTTASNEQSLKHFSFWNVSSRKTLPAQSFGFQSIPFTKP